jgi:amidohydrolase
VTPPGRPDDRLLARSQALLPRLVELRRHLHRHPELSYHESGTRDFLEAELTALGFACRRVADTGLLAALPSSERGPAVVLRAELDALPIEEETGAPYRSENRGVMHACGHDAHMTMVFGAGLILRDLAPGERPRFALLFQPAEEVPPGGARKVLDSAALDELPTAAIFGLHVDPRFPAGRILLKRGALMAASDRFRVTIEGKGGHGGYPHLTVDPIVVAAQVILGLQTIVARQVEPVEAAVISVGRIEGGTADNIIPGQVTFSGTIRSHNAEVRRLLPERIERTARGIAESAGAAARFQYLPGHPGLSNDPATIDKVERLLEPVLGRERIVALEKAIMGGEDFSHYLEVHAGAFLRIGVRNEEKGCVHPIHSPRFDLDEEMLPIGAAALAAVAAGWNAAE